MEYFLKLILGLFKDCFEPIGILLSAFNVYSAVDRLKRFRSLFNTF